MNTSLPTLAALLLSAGLALGDPETNLRDLQTLQTPTLSAEELKQISFTTKIDPMDIGSPLQIELHNPFRDKSIRGVVVHVQSRTAEGKEESLDVFADLDCGPLQTAGIGVPLFNAAEIAKRSPLITLKEVHRETQAPESSDDQSKILKLPTFSPDELKQLPFSWFFPKNQGSPTLNFDLHNPFRDKTIHGIVLQVKYKSAEGKEQSLEVFHDLFCGPLSHARSSVEVFNANEISEGSPVVTLKEVHREGPAGAAK